MIKSQIQGFEKSVLKGQVIFNSLWLMCEDSNIFWHLHFLNLNASKYHRRFWETNHGADIYGWEKIKRTRKTGERSKPEDRSETFANKLLNSYDLFSSRCVPLFPLLPRNCAQSRRDWRFFRRIDTIVEDSKVVSKIWSNNWRSFNLNLCSNLIISMAKFGRHTFQEKIIRKGGGFFCFFWGFFFEVTNLDSFILIYVSISSCLFIISLQGIRIGWFL